ncbi:DUF4148 domain-containing protein [Paucibacter sp. KCTC 42545]|uniref:DUF4148 domain-containing protein n=1 Tax=Paucibacter sp. KCTC 42545 TaxID=1768242 RepID=UPI000733AF7B|nr:hypothetical protein [Paucibacter sp. KCTC 42545]ALT79003.1 hypothetical protein AT984_19220 [Paucibacter sp. KCTC 42545]
MSKTATFTRFSFQSLRPAALLLAAAWAGCGPAQAADSKPAVQATPAASAPSTERSRAEVVAELVKARAEGQMPADNEVDPFTTQRRAEAKQREERRLAALQGQQLTAAAKSASQK